MNWFKSVLAAVGSFVDTVVPVGVGSRTKFAVIACPILGFAAPFVPAPYGVVVPVLQHVLCTAAPAFAVAGLVRK